MSCPSPGKVAAASTDLPVLLPFRVKRTSADLCLNGRWVGMLACVLLLAATGAGAQGGDTPASMLTVIIKWMPLLLSGFAFNILISLLAMALGTAAGATLGLFQVSELRIVRLPAWALTQFFRNAPWLVLLFFAMLTMPYQISVLGLRIPFPDWVKAVIGFALPVMANVAEILRGAIRSIPSAQWEAAESLGYTRGQTMRIVILPQCVKRMLPPWMNVYAIVTMATVLASIVGVTEMLTLTAQVHAAEGGRPELLAPLYAFAMFCFFIYCYPINLWTRRLERRFDVRS